jgi:hypothetical protein
MPSWIEGANAAPTLIGRMRALLAADDAVSFAELGQLDGFVGERTLFVDATRNLVLWSGVSAAAVGALNELLIAGECHLVPAGLLTYFCDGQIPRLPIAARRRCYVRPHWLPMVLMRGPAPAPQERHRRRRPRPGACGPRKRQLVPGKLRVRR